MRLPDIFLGFEVGSVNIHLSFEDFKPMVMQEMFINEIKQNNGIKIPFRKIEKGKSIANVKTNGSMKTLMKISSLPEGDDPKP